MAHVGTIPATPPPKKRLKKVTFLLAIFGGCAILFAVMRDKNNMKNEIETKRAEQVARGCQPTWGMTLPEYYAYQEKRREAHFAKKKMK